MSKLFLITEENGSTQEVEGPGQAAKAVKALAGEPGEPQKGKGKGGGNITPLLAKLQPGESLEVGGVRIERLVSDDDDEDEEEGGNETPTEPVPPVSEETEPATPPGGGDEGPKE